MFRRVALPQVKRGGGDDDDDVVKCRRVEEACFSFASKAAAVNSYAKLCQVLTPKLRDSLIVLICANAQGNDRRN